MPGLGGEFGQNRREAPGAAHLDDVADSAALQHAHRLLALEARVEPGENVSALPIALHDVQGPVEKTDNVGGRARVAGTQLAMDEGVADAVPCKNTMVGGAPRLVRIGPDVRSLLQTTEGLDGRNDPEDYAVLVLEGVHDDHLRQLGLPKSVAQFAIDAELLHETRERVETAQSGGTFEIEDLEQDSACFGSGTAVRSAHL